jgi:hypothetical protein
MPRTRTVMRRIREVVRLKFQLGLNGRLERLPIRPDTGRSREGLG